MRFRRRPVEVEAFQLTEANVASPEQWPEWGRQANALNPASVGAVFLSGDGSFVYCRNRAGTFSAYVGDWIVPEPDAEAMAWRRDDFAASFEPIEGDYCHAERIQLRRDGDRSSILA